MAISLARLANRDPPQRRRGSQRWRRVRMPRIYRSTRTGLPSVEWARSQVSSPSIAHANPLQRVSPSVPVGQSFTAGWPRANFSSEPVLTGLRFPALATGAARARANGVVKLRVLNLHSFSVHLPPARRFDGRTGKAEFLAPAMLAQFAKASRILVIGS